VLIKEFKTPDLTDAVVLNVIRQLSPRSYLLLNKTVSSPEELHICVCNQIRKVEEKKKIRFDDYAILKDIHLIEIDGKRIITAAGEEQKMLAGKLGVDLYD
jgi:hypothetical protein